MRDPGRQELQKQQCRRMLERLKNSDGMTPSKKAARAILAMS
jgi:hypothetical protein